MAKAFRAPRSHSGRSRYRRRYHRSQRRGDKAREGAQRPEIHLRHPQRCPPAIGEDGLGAGQTIAAGFAIRIATQAGIRWLPISPIVEAPETPTARRMSGYEAMIEGVRFAEDSPLGGRWIRTLGPPRKTEHDSNPLIHDRPQKKRCRARAYRRGSIAWPQGDYRGIKLNLHYPSGPGPQGGTSRYGAYCVVASPPRRFRPSVCGNQKHRRAHQQLR